MLAERSRRVSVLGVEVDGVVLPQLLDHIADAVRVRDRLVIGHHNLHSARLVRDDSGMQRFFDRADTVLVDGMALVGAARAAGLPLERANRLTCVDWIPALLAVAQRRSWRVFLLASDAQGFEKGIAAVRECFPSLDVGGRDGWFSMGSPEDDDVVAAIAAARPDVLLVGMGMPRQERWLADRLDALDVPVVATVGGWLDYVAGTRVTPPRWVASLGFEWLVRLVDEPRRLGHRYLVEPWPLVPTLAREVWAARSGRLRRRVGVRSA
jgi:N-acetylglucosaminyldiphosphoundecaprenol N-acetyl-beta-D-mannosaminyltransferase